MDTDGKFTFMLCACACPLTVIGLMAGALFGVPILGAIIGLGIAVLIARRSIMDDTDNP